jgi:hypothetical protein
LIDESLFENGYIETRSTRHGSAIKKSYDFLFFSITKNKEKTISQSLKENCNLPKNVEDIICRYLNIRSPAH